MPEDRHNWISKLKMEGNQWEDEAAKRAATQGNEEQVIKTMEAVRIKDKTTGRRVAVGALHKLYRRKQQKQNEDKLKTKTKDAFSVNESDR